MVLFNEAQTTLLLDLYLHFRSNPQNLTSGGVLLKMHARDELTRALNRFFKREAPWTESQVTVKFKNLRSEYIELKWLAAQPGFQLDGQGVSDEWWAEIKARRPKVHAFKGKLPWPFFHKMAVIVDNAAAPVADPRSAQRISHLLAEMAADGAANGATSSTAASAASAPRSYANSTNNSINNNGGIVDGYADTANGASASSASNATNNGTMELVAPARPVAAAVVPQASVALAGKRPRDGSVAGGSRRPRRRLAELSADERARQQSLATSVEHGSMAAADMARGFNDLVAMYQQQAAKCAHAETAAAVAGLGGDDSLDVQEQRQVLVSLAVSLEKSAQATAEMAKGYRDLVAFFIQESEDEAP